MNKNVKVYLILCGLSFLIEIMTAVVRKLFGFPITAVISFGIFFLLIVSVNYLTNKKYKIKFLLFSLLSGILIIQLPIRLFTFSESLISLPEFIFHVLGLVSGYIFLNFKTIYFKLGLAFFSVILNVFIIVYGYPLWLNKLNYGTFSGEVFIKNDQKIMAYDADGKKILIGEKPYTVLDFWFSSCKPCFDGFPEFQEVYLKYKPNKSIAFYAINTPMPNDKIGDSFHLIKSLNYTFPVLQAKDGNIAKKMLVVKYPTLILIDKEGNIIFKGEMQGLKKKLTNLGL
ncbi:TlpA disulfide reductase family protein [Pedobacter sp.]|uniref:TlpA disulfide reductase family protein n=1 Tax=Pedobacter sp. TaxID=1411316 RepID=UPI003BAB7D25